MTARTRLDGPPHECPNGCGEYERLSRHWSPGRCLPEIPADVRAVVEGMILGNGGVAGQTNMHVHLRTTNEAVAQWVYQELGWLALSLTRIDSGEKDDRAPVFGVKTHTHPGLNRYRRWYRGGDSIQPPDEYGLSQPVGRIWWACVGGLEWHGDYDSQVTATISALADERAAWVTRLLADAGINPTRVSKRLQWHGQQVRDWLAWLGRPVPGVEYKWATDRERHRALREETENE